MSRQSIVDRYHQRIAQGDRSKLSKSELASLITDFIEQLAALKSRARIEAFCLAEIALLEKGYPQPTVGKVYLPMYRKALKLAIADGSLPLTKNTSHQYSYSKRTGDAGSTIEHFALTYLKYDTATYGEFAAASAGRNNTKQDNLQPVELAAFLAVTTDLLESDNPFDLAAGIAAATGRRFSEVVAKGTFTSTNDPYWLSFTGQLKKRAEADQFLTPCLVPATTILAALERLRSHPRLVLLSQGSPDALNRSLADSVKRSVQSHFGGIVPILPGEQAVSVHNLRGVYAQICTYYFCPPERTTARFLQECLGHVISAAELKRGNSAATQYYFHYYLVDAIGNHLSAQGVLLGVDAPVESEWEAEWEAEAVVPDDLVAIPGEMSQAAVPAVDLSPELAALVDRVSQQEQRINSLEKALKDAHRRIDQLLTIVQPDIPRNSKRRTPAASKILMAINAIMEWNSHHEPQFAVSQTLLLKATGCNRPAIQRVLIDLAEEIDRHHTQLAISARHQPRDLDAILEFLKETVDAI
jgi:integrase